MTERNGTELENVRGWIRTVKQVLTLLEHAQAHLEEVAEDEEERDVPVAEVRRSAETVPAPLASNVAPLVPRSAVSTPQQRAQAAMEAAGYGPTADRPRQPRGRTFVTPGLRQAIIDAARRRPKPTVAVLAQEFDVSTATISRIMRQQYEQEEEQWEGGTSPPH